ncbi:calmodulin-regulated spectrin-associated protein 1-like isoform X3 [Dreissena polymorpha]|uniref:Patronin n=1 Tax=Dreissena polymorpha TaxID=45954 RepID=A0A9D4NIB9_DREPO|nr:calmodulin-regulated spectrin-associated protein 1-like isoform X3 [Dreissena polymorpha]KAH3897127.1 hypothetical protein DPMN_021312 [Dreissena polymorpha]
MDTWQSDGAEDSDGEIVEIMSVEEYDGEKAKALASLSWVLCKAYQDKVPTEFHDPFYINGEGSWTIKPRLANLLASSELYCLACKNMFGDNASQWAGHWSIIQVLSRKGIYAVGSDSNDVTETILMQSAPFKLKAHLALIDALMKAFCGEIMSVERVTQTVRRFSSFNASSELPNDSEEAVLFWVNKVCATVQVSLQDRAAQLEAADDPQETSNEPPAVPMLLRLVEDVGDGCSIAALISFYCPSILRIQDVCLKSNVGIADSLYNLRLIKSFCERHLPYKTWHFTFEDLLYSHVKLKVNILMLIAEIFYWFEIRTVPVVTGAGITGTPDAGRHTSGTVSRVPSVPISNVTKQSFQRHRVDSELRCSSAPDPHKGSPTLPHRAQPLLHRRQQNNGAHDDVRQSLNVVGGPAGSQSLNVVGGPAGRQRGPPRESVVAWPEKCQQSALMAESGSGDSRNLLANVSIDSDMNASFSSGSIDLGDLDTSPRDVLDPTPRLQGGADTGHVISFSLQNQKGTPFSTDIKRHDLESVNSVNLRVDEGFDSKQCAAGLNSESITAGNFERLFPAKLKQAKEKTSVHSKEEEQGEVLKWKTANPTSKVKKGVTIDPQSTVINSQSASVGHDMKLPFESQVSADQCSPSHMDKSDPIPRKFEAFFVGGSVDGSVDLPTHRSDVTVAESYIIDHVHTPEAARAAGIPVIETANQSPRSLELANQSPRSLELANQSPRALAMANQIPRSLSREGSVASSKSSGEFSDHESQKIHADHKTQESVQKHALSGKENFLDTNDPANFIIRKPVLVSKPPKTVDFENKIPSTTFSQIKQLRNVGNTDNSGFVYMQQGQDDNSKPSSLKDTFHKKQQEKKSLFNSSPSRQPVPNSTQPMAVENEATSEVPAANAAAGQELLKIKMKLEEKRKAIERKKHTQEIQQQKIRQRLGKAAFLHVVGKPKDGPSDTTELQAENGTAQMTSTANNARTAAQSPRSLNARDGIQQTIENVRNNWFNKEDHMSQGDGENSEGEGQGAGLTDSEMSSSQESQGSQQGRRLLFDRRSASVERVASLAEQRIAQPDTASYPRSEGNGSNIDELSAGMSTSPVFSQQSIPSPPRLSVGQSGSFVERQSRSDLGRKSDVKPERQESYDEYSNSLDKLNQSLTDLQGEIMKLSLKKGQQLQVSRSRSKSPTQVEAKLIEKQPALVDSNVERTSAQHKSRSSSEPRQLAQEGQQPGNYASLPRQPPAYAQHGQQHQLQQYAMSPTSMVGQIGPIYGTHGHYMQSPGHGFPSYVLGPGQGQMTYPQMQPPFHQSPPGFPHTGGPGMYPGQPYPGPHSLVSPPSAAQPGPYSTMYTSPGVPSNQFQPLQPLPGPYTNPSHMGQYLPQGHQPQPHMFDMQQAYNQHSSVQNPVSSTPEAVQLRSSQIRENRGVTNDNTRQFKGDNSDSNVQSSRSSNSDINKSNNVSDKSDSGVTRITGKTSSSNSYVSSVISDFAAQVTQPGGQVPGTHSDDLQGSSLGTGADLDTSTSGLDVTPVGFVVGQDDTSLDQSAEEEMHRKKEKLEKMRLKRVEEQERKRLKLEQDMNRRREMERLKQEESDRRKSEEKARREAIFKQYITKKDDDEEGPPKKEKPKQRTRPKSMFVKPELVEGFEGAGSVDDLTSRVMSASVGPEPSNGAQLKGTRNTRSSKSPQHKQVMRKAVSMNTLHNGSGDGRSLAYGGLTHRRPLSPDPNRTRKGQRSNESSESGSSQGGVDYAGPKLFVKPSAKSNRHIIINAISHCCLAGSVNTEQKNKVLEEIAKSNAKHFIILFRDSSCGYRGLYGFDPDTEDCFKILGVGPRSIQHDMVEKYYKYNSGGKSFSEVVSTKHISVSIDAVSLQNAVWKPAKPPAKAM